MGNRLLKESIRFDRKIDGLDFFEEVLFYRLLTAADDYGIYYADPVILARTLFPLKKDVDEKRTAGALEKLEAEGLVRRYSAKGEEWLVIVSWKKHQRLRNSRQTHPAPDGWIPEEPEKNNGEEEETALPEEQEQDRAITVVTAEAHELPVIELPLNDNTEYGVTQAEVNEYTVLYPAVDVVQELRKMRGWCLADADRRKTRKGIRKFINSWMARAQDQGGNTGRPAGKSAVNPYDQLAVKYEAEEQAGIVSPDTAEGGGGR